MQLLAGRHGAAAADIMVKVGERAAQRAPPDCGCGSAGRAAAEQTAVCGRGRSGKCGGRRGEAAQPNQPQAVARLQETKLINPIYDGSLEAMFNTAALNELMRTSFKSRIGVEPAADSATATFGDARFQKPIINVQITFSRCEHIKQMKNSQSLQGTKACDSASLQICNRWTTDPLASSFKSHVSTNSSAPHAYKRGRGSQTLVQAQSPPASADYVAGQQAGSAALGRGVKFAGCGNMRCHLAFATSKAAYARLHKLLRRQKAAHRQHVRSTCMHNSVERMIHSASTKLRAKAQPRDLPRQIADGADVADVAFQVFSNGPNKVPARHTWALCHLEHQLLTTTHGDKHNGIKV
eukprot:365861-Chlamydomonas_euryale.AAC.40